MSLPVRKMMLYVLVGSVVLILAVIAIRLGGKAARTAAQPAVPPRVVKICRVGGDAEPGDISYPGRVQPVRHAELFFRVSGPVIEQKLRYGQTVEPGEVLMRIDPRDYEEEVERLTHETEAQKVQSELAEIEYQRQKKLIESSAVSRSAYDSARTKRDAADAELKMLETSLKIARNRLSDTVLKAPFHGTIGDIKIQEHEVAAANQPVVMLEDLREIEIKVNVPAGNLPAVGIYEGERFEGMRFAVTFPGRGDQRFQAAITEFKPSADSESETFELILRMPQPHGFIVLPGMTAEVHGLPKLRTGAFNGVNVPFSAVVHRDGKSIVWVFDPKSATIARRIVVVGPPAAGDVVALSGGLKKDEWIVGAGGDWLEDGMKVSLLNPEVLNEAH